MPTAAQQNDPKFMNEWRVRWRTAQANPVVALTNNRLDWLNGPGACVPESRHRLILSAVGLGALLFVTIGLSLGVRARKKPGAGLPWRDRSGAGTMRA
jgi:hypothetical protein